MKTPRWYLAAMAVVALVVIAGLVMQRASVGRVARVAPDPASDSPVATAPWQGPPQAPRLAEPAAATPAVPAGVPAAPIDGVTYATRYADDMCACQDGACIDQVNRAAGGRLGQARATRATASLDDAFRRAMTCAREIRAREAVSPG